MYNNDPKLMERVNVLQKQVVELGMQLEQESQAANDCIVEILESYMEFIDIVQFNAKVCDLPEQYQRQLNTLCVRRKNDWQPILETARATQKEKTNGEVLIKNTRGKTNGK